ncbi:hypothetical protein [Sphingobium aquiterrae]|uniref:bestrophin-like domain n=1 Tax=Sphingobium aquiterrae TaxID=2038656 RepID=UPI0030179D5E
MILLQTLPLPVVGLGILIALLLAMEAGFLLQRRMKARHPGKSAAAAAPDYLLSAVLGLLALLLGFTFSLTLNRYEARRDLVVQEANAIGTTWLRAQLLEGPNRMAMSNLLRAYAKARIDWSHDPAPVPDSGATEAIQKKLWAETGVAIRTEPSAQLSNGLMVAMNESFDVASARGVARSAHIPDEVLAMLLLYAILSSGMLGHIMANRAQPHRGATTLLLALVSLAMVLILDVDRPLGGAIQVSQKPLEDLRASMK